MPSIPEDILMPPSEGGAVSPSISLQARPLHSTTANYISLSIKTKPARFPVTLSTSDESLVIPKKEVFNDGSGSTLLSIADIALEEPKTVTIFGKVRDVIETLDIELVSMEINEITLKNEDGEELESPQEDQIIYVEGKTKNIPDKLSILVQFFDHIPKGKSKEITGIKVKVENNSFSAQLLIPPLFFEPNVDPKLYLKVQNPKYSVQEIKEYPIKNIYRGGDGVEVQKGDSLQTIAKTHFENSGFWVDLFYENLESLAHVLPPTNEAIEESLEAKAIYLHIGHKLKLPKVDIQSGRPIRLQEKHEKFKSPTFLLPVFHYDFDEIFLKQAEAKPITLNIFSWFIDIIPRGHVYMQKVGETKAVTYEKESEALQSEYEDQLFRMILSDLNIKEIMVNRQNLRGSMGFKIGKKLNIHCHFVQSFDDEKPFERDEKIDPRISKALFRSTRYRLERHAFLHAKRGDYYLLHGELQYDIVLRHKEMSEQAPKYPIEILKEFMRQMESGRMGDFHTSDQELKFRYGEIKPEMPYVFPKGIPYSVGRQSIHFGGFPKLHGICVEYY